MAEFPAKHLLSLCLIVRDEAHNLPRLLASAAPWVGQLVVVDTGSVDATVAIAEAWGARVENRPWENSFATARNQTLNLASTPWALLLDADEELVVSDAVGFAEALLGDTPLHPPAYAVDCHDLRDDGQVGVAPLLRLFRRDLPNMRFEGAVHEQLVAVTRGQVGVGHARFMHFRHDGHISAALRSKDKDNRNLLLARAQLEHKPDDAFAWFCLGQALLTMPTPSRQAEAVEAYSQALRRMAVEQEGEAFVVSLFANQAHTQLQLRRAHEALTTLHAGVRAFPHSADLLFARGHLFLQEGRLQEAEADLRACLSPDCTHFFVRLDPATSGHKARTQLALCLIKQRRLQEALPELEQAVTEAPEGEGLARAILEKLLSLRS